MRSYIRHPSDIPIEVEHEPVSTTETRELHDVSCGGLSFSVTKAIEPETIIRIQITCVEPSFEAPCRVTWCRPVHDQYLIGVEFLAQQDEFRARMVEQVCHIEHYKREVLQREGRQLTGEQAAREWIKKYAKDFPALNSMALGGH